MLTRLMTPRFRPDDGSGGAGAADPPERPDWLPEKFKSPEELARAYDEAERRMSAVVTEREQDRQQFREALEQLQTQQERQAQQPPPVRYDPDQDPLLAAYDNAFVTGDARAALAIQMQLTQQMQQQERAAMAQMLQEQLQPIVGQLTDRQTVEREMQINAAEEDVKRQAIAAGLDYDASRAEIIEVIQSFGGMPAQGTRETYADFLSRAVKVVHADAVLAQSAAQQQQRGEKLSLAQVQPGARAGRLAQGTPQESDAWAEIKNAKAGTYGELMGGGR